MIEYENFKFTVTMQGGPIVNEGVIITKSDNIIAASIDLASKYAEIFGFSCDENNCPIIYLESTENTLYYKEGAEKEVTEITFLDYSGWNIHCAEISRYTLNICLVKREKEN